MSELRSTFVLCENRESEKVTTEAMVGESPDDHFECPQSSSLLALHIENKINGLFACPSSLGINDSDQ